MGLYKSSCIEQICGKCGNAAFPVAPNQKLYLKEKKKRMQFPGLK